MLNILSIGMPPRDVLAAVAGAVIVGVIVIGLASLLKNWRDVWRASSYIRKLKEIGLWEALRDLGIAFVVAGIVSGIYEWSTRSIEQNKKAVELFNTINSYFVGEPIWNEYREEVLRAPFLRRNIEIRLKISRESQSQTGEKVTLPPYRAVLWMEYAYDLYPLSKESWSIPLQHELDYEMYDDALKIPRFELVKLTRKVSQWRVQTRTLEGSDLESYVENNRTFKLNPLKFSGIDFPSPDENRPVRILNTRYEIVSPPGQYRLAMPVLAARTEDEKHTITISIDSIPDDLEPEVTSFYRGLTFYPDSDRGPWHYDGVMFPGQGFNILLKPKVSRPPLTPAQ